MKKIYTSEQFWKLYKNLPQDLKNTLFAEETGGAIYEVCKKNNLIERVGDVADCVGAVLIGLLPPTDLSGTLEKDLNILPETAKKISQEISRSVFYLVKSSLEILYSNVGFSSPSEKSTPAPSESSGLEMPYTGDDGYREPLE
jgi:hypothetical protein